MDTEMNSSARMQAACEYAVNPLGVPTPEPRFSWRLPPEAGMQQSYRLRVAAGPEALSAGALLWDSGEVRSPKNTGVRYAGRPLAGKTRYWWQVTVRAENGRTDACEPQFFETALLPADPWQAEWIAAPGHTPGVSDLLRRDFTLPAVPVSGRLYVTGVGYYEAFLNGSKVGDRVLEPGWTDYRRRVLYSVYDVTPLLRAGENTLGLELAEGWYGHQHPSFTGFIGHQPDWLGTPAAIAELDVRMADGSTVTLCSRPGEFQTHPGAVTENSIYDGEVYDARRECPGWNRPGFIPKDGWIPAAAGTAPGGRLVAQQMPPIRVNCRRRPLSVRRVGTHWIVDSGQNLSGWLAIRVRGARGASVTIRYGETLREDGTVNQDNLRGARSRDVYILRGDGEESWHPRFTYHGFRYAEIIPEGEAEVTEAVAEGLWSAVPETGRFSSSEELLNRIEEAMLWTERSNMPGLPTDCPQRDERMAWLNDVTVRCEEAMHHFDLRLFYEKWLEDIADAQTPAGSVPDTAPFVYGGNPAFHVASCYVLIPWFLYLYEGDDTALIRHYEGMARYVRFLAAQRGEDGIIGAPYFGEWAPPAAECDQQSPWSAEPVNIPPGLITTTYLIYDCRIMEKAARHLGREAEAEAFAALGQTAAAAVNRVFYRPDEGCYATGAQACQIMPLFLGIAPEPERVFSHLLADLEAHGGHMTTGNQMTKYWFEVLHRAGRDDMALKMALDDTYPSLGYMIRNGATTLWERWENLDGSGMNSHNHPMNGAYTVWYFKGLAGIGRDEEGVCLQPAVRLAIRQVSASVETPCGELGCSFEKQPGRISLQCRIPWNTPARLRIPLEGLTRIERQGTVLWDARTAEPSAFLELRPAPGEHSFTLFSA